MFSVRYESVISEKPENITIKQAHNGFIVKAGCKMLVFDSQKKLFSALELYFNDYEKAYKKYIEG